MQRFYFEKGLTIQHDGRTLEYHHRTDAFHYFENVQTGDIEKLTEEQFWNKLECRELAVLDAFSSSKELQLPEPPPAPIVLSEKHEANQVRKLDYVKGMQVRGITRGQLILIAEAITEIATEIKDAKPPSVITVSRWMCAFERARGDVYVLVSGHAKKIKRERHEADHEALVQRTIDDHYLTRDQLKASDVYQDNYTPALTTLNVERTRSGQSVFAPISLRTFNRRIDALDKYDVAVARLGRQEARHMFRMISGHLPSDRPLDYVEIDHAKLRLWVVDDTLLLPLGRPWVTAIRDRYSGMLLGFYVSFRGPSLASTFSAIRHSLESHHKLNEKWPDLEHHWMSFGPGTFYVSDRGSDFLSPRYRSAVFEVGGYPIYCESRTPWHKANIERVFLTLHADLLETLPGQVFKGVTYSRDYNPKEDAVVRFSTLIYLMVKWACDYLPYTVKTRKGARPIDLWTDGLAEAPIGQLPNTDARKIKLGMHQMGSLGNEGIRFRDLSYTNDLLRQLYRSVYKTYKKEIPFVVDESNLGSVHVAHPRERRWFEVECTRPEYASKLSLQQHQYVKSEAKAAGESVHDIDQLCRARVRIKARMAEEIDRKDSVTKTKLARYCGIDSTAIFTGRPKSLADLQSQANSDLLVPELAASETGKILIPDAPFLDVPIFEWGVF